MGWSVGNPAEDAILEKIRAKAPAQRTHDEVRLVANRIRRDAVEAVHLANSGHPGGPLGLADIYAVLYFKILNYDVKNTLADNRDRILLSNGHVCAVKYAAMALAGYFPEEELATFRRLGSRLQGHPSTRYFPEVENSSGSLGQGLANAHGVALGLKVRKNPARVFVGMSDGECQEGMTWEAAMAAAHYKTDNLIAFIDWNNIQIDGFVDDVMSLGDFEGKFKAFGWQTKVADGHDVVAIEEAFRWAEKAEGGPKVILFKTRLGKGVSFMDNNPDWHGSPPKKDQRDQAIRELEDSIADIIKKLS